MADELFTRAMVDGAQAKPRPWWRRRRDVVELAWGMLLLGLGVGAAARGEGMDAVLSLSMAGLVLRHVGEGH